MTRLHPALITAEEIDRAVRELNLGALSPEELAAKAHACDLVGLRSAAAIAQACRMLRRRKLGLIPDDNPYTD